MLQKYVGYNIMIEPVPLSMVEIDNYCFLMKNLAAQILNAPLKTHAFNSLKKINQIPFNFHIDYYLFINFNFTD